MAIRIASSTSVISTDALFRAWIQEIHYGLLAFGWQQSGDTGQIDVTTATKPSGATTYAGFGMYNMNDALQGSYPCYMRIDYGTGSSATNAGLKVQIGTATNGTGTLQGNTSSLVTISQSAATALLPLYSSGSTNRYQLFFWPGATGMGFFINVERDKDSSGNDGGSGFSFLAGTNSAAITAQFVSSTGTVPAAETKFVALTSQQTSQVGLSKVTLAPIHMASGPLRNPILGMLICGGGDFLSGSINTLTVYSATHTYLALTTSPTAFWFSSTAFTTAVIMGALMQFE